MWPDDMGTKRRTVVSLMPANEREVARLYVSPDPFVALLRFKRMVKIAERNQIAWSVCAAVCDWMHVVNVEFKPRGAARDLASRVIFCDDNFPKVLPEGWVARPMIENLQYGLVALGQDCCRVMKVTDFGFAWLWIQSFPFIAKTDPLGKLLFVP